MIPLKSQYLTHQCESSSVVDQRAAMLTALRKRVVFPGGKEMPSFPQSQHGATGTVWMLALCLDVQPRELYLMWLLRAYRYSLKEFDLY